MQSQPSMDDFRASVDNPIPVFLEKAINFIEKEGLDAEGLYRVPGNRAHVDLLFQEFEKGTASVGESPMVIDLGEKLCFDETIPFQTAMLTSTVSISQSTRSLPQSRTLSIIGCLRFFLPNK